MAEMPNPDAPPAIPSFTSELRVAAVADDEPAPAPEPVLIEAPANLRGAAIAKLQADKVRKPIVDNKPCWDKPTCREVQLGIPSPVESESVVVLLFLRVLRRLLQSLLWSLPRRLR
jgi:hypothetical protein